MSDGRVVIGDRVLKVKPFNLKTLRIILPKVAAIKNAVDDRRLFSADEVDGMIDIFMGALRDNDPPVTKEFLEDAIDVAMLEDLFKQIMHVSGFVEVKPGEVRSQ